MSELSESSELLNSSELHKFLFEGLPVRGMVVRLTDAWQEILRRRAYPEPVRDMLGEMTAAAALMQSNIKFDGALILQIMGDSAVQLAVVEVQSNRALRATAKVKGDIPENATLTEMVNRHKTGRCAITLDPSKKFPGQQPYQGVVSLHDQERISDVIQNYMRTSEQLDSTLVLAANGEVAAGLLIQRLPVEGLGNLGGNSDESAHHDEAYQRIALLASSLKREELLTLDAETILHRLFWEEPILRFEPQRGADAHHFACTCSRERVGKMIVNLGHEEAESIIQERETIEVGCDFCGAHYRFDAIDVTQLFREHNNV